MQIVLEIPDQLGAQLQQFGDRLPELLERGLQELLSDRYVPNLLGDREIITKESGKSLPICGEIKYCSRHDFNSLSFRERSLLTGHC